MNKNRHVFMHTLNITNQISRAEVSRICRVFGIQDYFGEDNLIYISGTGCRGINNISIKQKPKMKDGVRTGFVYSLNMEINASRLLGRSEVLMLEASRVNVNEMFDKINDYLARLLQLDVRNSHCERWTLVRLDCGFDLKISLKAEEIEIMIRAMHRSLSLLNKNNCVLPAYKSNLSGKEKYESLRFGNTLYTYNIYSKEKEIIKHQKNISQQALEEAKGIIRVEMQLNSVGVSKKIGSPQEFGLLANGVITAELMDIVKRDMKTFFGTGKYMTFSDAMRVIAKSKYTEEEKMLLKDIYCAAYKYDFQPFVDQLLEMSKEIGEDVKMIKMATKKQINIFEKMGIAIGGLRADEVNKLSEASLENINIYIDQMMESSTKKGVFSKIAPIEGGRRLKCQPTLRDVNGVSHRYQITGATREVVEKKVFDTICKVCKDNFLNADSDAKQRILLQTKIEAEDFMTIVECETVLKATEEYIKRLDSCIRRLSDE